MTSVALLIVGTQLSLFKPLIIKNANIEPSADALSTEQLTAIVEQRTSTSALVPTALKLPASLQHSNLPLLLDMYDDGSLVINIKILHLFDFYLSALGEEQLEQVVTRIKQSLNQQLKPTALTQSLAILSGYLAYLNDITKLKKQVNQQDTGEYRLDSVINAHHQINDLRELHLSNEVIAAFFAKSDAYESYMLEQASISQRIELNPEQKQRAQQLLNQRVPSWIIEQQQRANHLNKYRVQYQQLLSNGADEQQLQQLALDEFSEESALRLQQLAQDRSQWQQRLSQYRGQLDIIISMALGSSESVIEIELLRAQYFNLLEIKRVKALDSIYLAN